MPNRPLKAIVYTRMNIRNEWLNEVKAILPGITIDIVLTTKQMKVYFNETWGSIYGDFNSVRDIIKDTGYDIRAFFMPYRELRALGITNHLALYDNQDKDGVLDFYVGLNDALDDRARANGFKSNFAWEFVHEALHGMEQDLGEAHMATIGDRTHAWEAQGRLKELVDGDVKIPYFNTIINLLAQIAGLTKPKMRHPLDLPYRNQITQQYGVENPIYNITGHHIGCDYGCPVGTPVYAPADGQLIVTTQSGERGNYIQYKHGDYVLEVRHLSKMATPGLYKQGDVIGWTGATGSLCTGPHACVVVFTGGRDGLPFINKTNYLQLTADPNKVYV